MKLSAMRLAPWLLVIAAMSASVGCSGTGPTASHATAGGDEIPRAAKAIDLATLAKEIEQGAPPPRPIWSALPAHVRRAVELRLAPFATVEQKLAEVERRRMTFDLRDETATATFAELFFLLEDLAFGPPSDARTEAWATLASQYAVAERVGDFAKWSEKLSRSLDLPTRDGDFSAFLRAYADGGSGMHRAYVAATLREKGPKPAIARALLSHAWFVYARGDLERTLVLREAAVRVDPDQPADTWITLGTSYAFALDAPRAAKALLRSESAPAGTAKPAELAKRRDELKRRIKIARDVAAAGTPTTPEARLSLGLSMKELGAESRALQLLTESAKELPRDARPRVALARLRLMMADGGNVPKLARDVVASLDPARKLEGRTSELYELWFGLSGLTALEDVLRGGTADPNDVLKRAGAIVARFRDANAEHAAFAPNRAATLGVVLDLATAGLGQGTAFADALPDLLRSTYPKGRAVQEKYPTDPGARMVGVSLAAFAPDLRASYGVVVAKPQVDDPPALVVTRAEIALDIGISLGDAKMVAEARDLARDVPPGERIRDARAAAVRGDAEVYLARTKAGGSLEKAEAHYKEALRGLPTGEQTRVKSNLAWVYAQTARVELAADAFRDAVGTASKESSSSLAMAAMANLALQVRQLDDVEELTTKALTVDPSDAMASMTRALARKQKGRADDARADAVQALQRIDKSLAAMPHRQWGRDGAFGDASLDFNLGISSESPTYDLQLSAFHRLWWFLGTFDLGEIRAIATAQPAPPAPTAKPAAPKKR